MNTLFFVTRDRPDNNTFNQMSAPANYLQNDSPLKLLAKRPARSGWHSENQYLLIMNRIREKPHKSAPAKARGLSLKG